VKTQLDKYLPEFDWTKAKQLHYQDERWIGTPKDPDDWPEGTEAEIGRSVYSDGSGSFYQLAVKTDVDLVYASDIQDKVPELSPVLRAFRYQHDKVIWHRDRLSKQTPPPQGARVFHKSEVKPGDVLLPAPGKELLIWSRKRGKELVIAPYRHDGHGSYNLPGVPPGQQEVTVERVNTRGIFVRVSNEPKARKIASLSHHGQPITDGWLLKG
jgi:hypothetical protein